MRWLLLTLALFCGCSKAASQRDEVFVPLGQVPPAVMKAAQAKLPDVSFTAAWKTAKGDYQLRGKNNIGKLCDVRVSEAGEILEAEAARHK